MCRGGAAVSTPPAATSVSVRLAWSSHRTETPVQVGTLCVGGGGAQLYQHPRQLFLSVSIWHGSVPGWKLLYRWVGEHLCTCSYAPAIES